MGKCLQCLTELSACNMIMVGYYSLTFLFIFLIPLAVYIWSTEIYRNQFMCYILLLATGDNAQLAELLFHYLTARRYIMNHFLFSFDTAIYHMTVKLFSEITHVIKII